MPNEPSFFQRLTGSMRGDDAAQTKRIDFTEEKGQEIPVVTAAAQNEEGSAPAAEKAEKKEQWMEEAQEGQLTIDVYQTDADLVITSTVAGVKSEDLDISITNDMVTIRGRRNRADDVPQENYFYQECYWGPFSRTVILPADVASEKAEATIHNGILMIKLPKVEKEQTKKIKVKSLA